VSAPHGYSARCATATPASSAGPRIPAGRATSVAVYDNAPSAERNDAAANPAVRVL
jgi:hypothetical protein